MPRHVIIGTAGHIDHGKSALVLALTGTDPDRLKEEKARGITIDLGFAHWTTDEFAFSFVDVPGHERFVKNMLAGRRRHRRRRARRGGRRVGDAADARALRDLPPARRAGDGLIAITKADLADADTIELVDDGGARPRGRVVPRRRARSWRVSSRTGDGPGRASGRRSSTSRGARGRAAGRRAPCGCRSTGCSR